MLLPLPVQSLRERIPRHPQGGRVHHKNYLMQRQLSTRSSDQTSMFVWGFISKLQRNTVLLSLLVKTLCCPVLMVFLLQRTIWIFLSIYSSFWWEQTRKWMMGAKLVFKEILKVYYNNLLIQFLYRTFTSYKYIFNTSHPLPTFWAIKPK